MKTARRFLALIFAAFVLFNVVMIPVLLLRVEEGFKTCFTFNFSDCGAAFGTIWVSWRIYRWINLAFVIALLITLIVALALYARGRRTEAEVEPVEVTRYEPPPLDDRY